ncbi:MAG: hypothetical protein RL557_826 [archaeon]|jgi:hypothetical protein
MKLGQQKKDKIIEQILSYLYDRFPKFPFTSEIAKEIARDEEFIKRLLIELREKKLVISINKNAKGDLFSRRMRWKLSNKVYDLFYAKYPK